MTMLQLPPDREKLRNLLYGPRTIIYMRRCNWEASATGRQYLVWEREISASCGVVLTVSTLHKPTTAQPKPSNKILYA
jgi:hypothetical protein